MTVAGVLTLVAIILGPLFGVALAMNLERRRVRRERRLNIFRDLMRTRRTPMWQDHVGALNLVEIEFHDCPKVLAKWKKLFRHLGEAQPRHPNEERREDMPEAEKIQRDNMYNKRLNDERQKLLALTLHAISRELDFKIEQLEIFEGGYMPQGWTDIELENSAVRRLFADIYLGRRMFPIGVFRFPDQQLQDGVVRTNSEREQFGDGGA